ncbi:unnamed protein product, partial [Ostreobium quekettii]
ERERQKKKEMEGLYDSFQHVCAALNVVQEENAALRVNNCRLQSMIEKHQTIVRSLEGGINNFPVTQAGALQSNFNPEGSSVDVSHTCASPQSMDASFPLDVTSPWAGLDTTCQATKPHHVLMKEMESLVQVIRNLLDANGIFISGVLPSEEVGRALRNLLGRVADMTADLFESNPMCLSEHWGNGMYAPQMELDEDSMTDWVRLLPILSLTGQQKVAIMNMRTEYLSVLFKIQEERAVLNTQAASATQECSGSAVPVRQCVHPAWDQLRRNVRRENDLMAQALRTLFFNVLDLTQAALLTLEAHPGGVDIMKLASAISALDANCHAPAGVGPAVPLDVFDSSMDLPPSIVI